MPDELVITLMILGPLALVAFLVFQKKAKPKGPS
jgi:hypothetical protein